MNSLHMRVKSSKVQLCYAILYCINKLTTFFIVIKQKKMQFQYMGFIRNIPYEYFIKLCLNMVRFYNRFDANNITENLVS